MVKQRVLSMCLRVLCDLEKKMCFERGISGLKGENPGEEQRVFLARHAGVNEDR